MEPPVVINFINILQAAFASIFLRQKLQSQSVTREKLLNLLLYKKRTCKMLVKLTPVVVNFINILQAAFASIFLHQTITKPNCN